jgi:hypothetical protein
VDGNDYTDYVADYSAPNTHADVDFDGDVDTILLAEYVR